MNAEKNVPADLADKRREESIGNAKCEMKIQSPQSFLFPADLADKRREESWLHQKIRLAGFPEQMIKRMKYAQKRLSLWQELIPSMPCPISDSVVA